MAMVQIWGNFILKESFRTNPIPFRPQNNGYHLHYRCDIQMIHGSIPAIIRTYQSSSVPALHEGTVAFILGRFATHSASPLEIESINIIPYGPSSVNIDLLTGFVPRISVLGHVIGTPTLTPNGTVLFGVNSTAYVRDWVQVATVIGAIPRSAHWPVGPPSPKPWSPIYITGPIESIDNNTLLPVVTIEDVTFEAGNHSWGQIANDARLRLSYHGAMLPNNITYSNFVSVHASHDHEYHPSSASYASVPRFPLTYPLPLETPIRSERELGPVPVHTPFNDDDHNREEASFGHDLSVISNQFARKDDDSRIQGFTSSSSGDQTEHVPGTGSSDDSVTSDENSTAASNTVYLEDLPGPSSTRKDFTPRKRGPCIFCLRLKCKQCRDKEIAQIRPNTLMWNWVSMRSRDINKDSQETLKEN
ncbi:hypothetical protein M422DRAFT_45364 [Sphaerobolus stellatus SS14]|nr:hypothetical protein M422DRAFT_45364 [Sphaerobolus stellatus SS14]